MQEHIHDPYKTPHKLPEPTVCPECGAVFHHGRWEWSAKAPPNAFRASCQACHRVRDKYPAGLVTLSGAFVRTHKDELLQLAHHQESAEKQAHPLHRIMRIEEHPDSISIETTDLHLPRRIAEAVEHAYRGELQLHYDREGHFLRANWRRES
jgi:NMD protein affecting ribosome stability and mRNA decay